MHRPPNLWQHPKSGIWYLRTYRADGGDGPRRSLGTRDLREAIEKAPQVRDELERTVTRPRAGREQWLRLSAADIAERRAIGTSDGHREKLESKYAVIIANLPDDRGPDVFDYEDAVAYVARRREQTWHGAPIRGQTIYRETAAIWRMLQVAKRRGLRAHLPDEWPKVRRDPKDKRKAGKHWEAPLIREYLAALDKEARDEAVIAALTQLRSAEIKRLRFDDVRRAPSGAETEYLIEISEQATKTRTARIVGLPRVGHDIIERRRQERPGEDLVFSARDHKKHRAAVCARLGFTCTLTLRDLRHTFLTEGLRGTADATAVMRAAGHKDLKTTEKYMSSTVARTVAVAAVAERVLDPDHLTRITSAKTDSRRGRKVTETPMVLGESLERATRLELATLSLGKRCPENRSSKNKHLRPDVSRVAAESPVKRGPVVDDPCMSPGSLAGERKREVGR